MASPPAALLRRARSLDTQSSREISSGGEDETEEEEPWAPHEVEKLESLVRSYGRDRHFFFSHYCGGTN